MIAAKHQEEIYGEKNTFFNQKGKHFKSIKNM